MRCLIKSVLFYHKYSLYDVGGIRYIYIYYKILHSNKYKATSVRFGLTKKIEHN